MGANRKSQESEARSQKKARGKAVMSDGRGKAAGCRQYVEGGGEAQAAQKI